LRRSIKVTSKNGRARRCSGCRREEKREPACKPGSVVDSHSSGMRVTAHLERPTRERRGPRLVPRPGHGRAAAGTRKLLPYLVLLRVGFTLPPVLPPARCALTAPFHPYRTPPGGGARRYIFCGTFRGLASPRRYLAPCPSEPGLSSAPANRRGGCPADSRARSLVPRAGLFKRHTPPDRPQDPCHASPGHRCGATVPGPGGTGPKEHR